MQEKQYEPARHNEKSPSEGMAAVNTHAPYEDESVKTGTQVSKENVDKEDERDIREENK